MRDSPWSSEFTYTSPEENGSVAEKKSVTHLTAFALRESPFHFEIIGFWDDPSASAANLTQRNAQNHLALEATMRRSRLTQTASCHSLDSQHSRSPLQREGKTAGPVNVSGWAGGFV